MALSHTHTHMKHLLPKSTRAMYPCGHLVAVEIGTLGLGGEFKGHPP